MSKQRIVKVVKAHETIFCYYLLVPSVSQIRTLILPTLYSERQNHEPLYLLNTK